LGRVVVKVPVEKVQLHLPNALVLRAHAPEFPATDKAVER
jgi:hypothetical protein